MVKVTIRRLRAGLTAASGLFLVGPAATGCASASGEHVDTTSTAMTTSTGSLTLEQVFPTTTTQHFGFAVQGPVDEYVRVGDRLAFDVSAYTLWGILYPTTPQSRRHRAHREAPRLLLGAVRVERRRGRRTAISTLSSWNVAAPYAVDGTTAPFTVPAGTDTMTFELTIVDTSDGTKVVLSDLDFASVPVFGGHYPLKHLVFDNDGSTLRQRVIEGGDLVQNGTVDFALTDWRADEIVQRSLLNTEIGTEQSNGRFGPVTLPLYGQVQYRSPSATPSTRRGTSSRSRSAPTRARPSWISPGAPPTRRRSESRRR